MTKHSFTTLPSVKYRRSMFNLGHSVKTSFNAGSLIPIDIQEVLPGDTFKVKTNVVCRLSSEFLRPIMDNIFLDVYHFFIPDRLLYDDFVSVMGENKNGAWANSGSTVIPTLPSGQVTSRSVADYFGLPVGVDLPEGEISLLPFRAFAKVYDEWFRDENLIDPMNYQTGEAVGSEVLNGDGWSPNNYTGMPPKVAKMHDYFTSCLPSPQKGSPVTLPIGTQAPVVYSDGHFNTDVGNGNYGIPVVPGQYKVTDRLHDNRAFSNEDLDVYDTYVGQANPEKIGMFDERSKTVVIPNFPNGGVQTAQTIGASPANVAYAGMTDGGESPIDYNDNRAMPVNLYAYLGNAPYADLTQATAITVNDLRFAFQTQKLLEKDARFGTRYTEYLLGHFGVQSGDYRLQRSEYLGGRRIPLNVIQVAQTTGSGSSQSPLAQLGAYSQTGGRTRFTKSFVEHGFILTVACVRYFHTYQQGVERMFTRKIRTDFYDPVYANLGEQPVYKSQLYVNGASSFTTPFGYQEAWADYRNRLNRVSGGMRNSVPGTQFIWHLADYYSGSPTLGQDFVEETPDNINRVITLDSSTTNNDQFIFDFYFDTKLYSVMPTYSVPGLVDHH